MNVTQFLTGPHYYDLGTLLLRLVLGVFFVLARFRWVYDPSRPQEPWLNAARHSHLINRLCTCGYGNHAAMSAFVATVEISAGLAVIFGLLTELALLGLLCVLSFGTYCTAYEKVEQQNPVDDVDCVSCYLWRVEGVYIIIGIVLLLSGPGMYSLDHWLLGA